jgi:hypothetical protein
MYATITGDCKTSTARLTSFKQRIECYERESRVFLNKNCQPRKGAEFAKKAPYMTDIMKLYDIVRETGFAIHCYHNLDFKQQHPLALFRG